MTTSPPPGDEESIQQDAVESVALLACVGGEHEDDFAVVVDFVEKPEAADPVPPSLRLVTFELLDVPPEEGSLPKLGIDVISQPGDYLIPARAEVRLEVGLELLCLEDPIVTQRSVPGLFLPGNVRF